MRRIWPLLSKIRYSIGYQAFVFIRGGVLLCKKLTADNGFEFASINELESEDFSVFFAHSCAAWKCGSNERLNGLLRRIIPKGTTSVMYLKQCLEELRNGVTRYLVKF